MILIRADGNSSIGVGHVMRCLSIADALKRKDKEVVFVTADDSMKSIIEDRGFSCVVLKSDYTNLLSDFENGIFEDKIRESESIIVDSYYVSEEYFNKIRNATDTLQKKESHKVIYIDDLCEEAYPVNFVINYNIYANKKKYEKLYSSNSNEYNTQFIIGSNYAPLRSEFSKGKKAEIREKVKDVLVMTGGADIHHTAFQLIKTIKDYRSHQPNSELQSICFHFVIGAMSQDYNDILNELNETDNIVIYKDVKDMLSLMCSCDMAVSAAGSTLYELCACGVPTITYVVADNQIGGEKAFVESESMLSIGDIRDSRNYCEEIIRKILFLEEDTRLRYSLHNRQSQIVDGLGADRIAQLISNN